MEEISEEETEEPVEENFFMDQIKDVAKDNIELGSTVLGGLATAGLLASEEEEKCEGCGKDKIEEAVEEEAPAFESIEDALEAIRKATEFIANATAVETEEVEDEVIEDEEVIEESINKDSFNKVLSEFYNKEISIDDIVKEGKELKITGEGLSLTLTESDSKNNVTKYSLTESETPMSVVTLLRNNELQCKFITK